MFHFLNLIHNTLSFQVVCSDIGAQIYVGEWRIQFITCLAESFWNLRHTQYSAGKM